MVLPAHYALRIITDADYSKVKIDRRSVRRITIFLHGMLLDWQAKTQRTVVLITAYAESVEATAGVK